MRKNNPRADNGPKEKGGRRLKAAHGAQRGIRFQAAEMKRAFSM